MEDRRQEISFGGCGFLGVYHIGVGKCIVDIAPHLFDEFEGFYGASAGAITAVGAACKCDPMAAYKWVKKMFEASREHRLLGMLHPSFDLYARLRKFLEEFLPKDAHLLCRHKVKISLTTLAERKNWLVSNFTTRKELINAVVASSFIPGYAGLKDLPVFRGKRCFDGGFSSNVPCAMDPNVVTVSPFSGGCDICPQGESASMHMLYISDQPLQISMKNMTRLSKALNPTSWEELEELFLIGYKDTVDFLKREGHIPEPVTRPMRRNSTQIELSHDDTITEYYSISGESSPVSFSRRQSIAGCEFLSCLDEEDEVSSESSSESLYNLKSVEEELQQIELDAQAERRKDGQATKSSWRSISWVLHSCTPTNLPLIHRLCKAMRTEDNSWEKDHSKMFNSITASWPSSMVVF